MRNWAIGKTIGMTIALLIGIVISISLLFSKNPGEQSLALPVLLVPYMVRRLARSSFADLKGGFVEFIQFFLVLILSITFIYPVIKLIQEIVLYNRIFKFTRNKNKIVHKSNSEEEEILVMPNIGLPEAKKNIPSIEGNAGEVLSFGKEIYSDTS